MNFEPDKVTWRELSDIPLIACMIDESWQMNIHDKLNEQFEKMSTDIMRLSEVVYDKTNEK
jgi:hypothetical protein